MPKLFRVVPLLLALLVPAVAFGGTKAGVTLPDTIELGGKKLVLNGLGVREATILNIDVYVAGLYLERKSSDAAAIIRSPGPKRLTLQFVRDVDRKDIVNAWNEGFEKNAGANQSKLAARVAQLNAWMTDLKTGDQLVFSHLPNRGVTVQIQGKTRGTIEGDDFAQALFSIWLGSHPPNKGLKRGLLGQ